MLIYADPQWGILTGEGRAERWRKETDHLGSLLTFYALAGSTLVMCANKFPLGLKST